MNQTKENIIKDDRMVFYGLRHIIELFISRGIMEEDIKRSGKFYSEHYLGGGKFEYPQKYSTK